VIALDGLRSQILVDMLSKELLQERGERFRNFGRQWGTCFRELSLLLFLDPPRCIPFANSGASSPLSEASTASFRMAVIRTLIETAPSPRASRATRQALTVALVKPARGSRPYHAKNSSSPRLYTRLVIGELTLSSARDFNRSHSFGFGTTIKSFQI
jgi:hypothetical protein